MITERVALVVAGNEDGMRHEFGSLRSGGSGHLGDDPLGDELAAELWGLADCSSASAAIAETMPATAGFVSLAVVQELPSSAVPSPSTTAPTHSPALALSTAPSAEPVPVLSCNHAIPSLVGSYSAATPAHRISHSRISHKGKSRRKRPGADRAKASSEKRLHRGLGAERFPSALARVAKPVDFKAVVVRSFAPLLTPDLMTPVSLPKEGIETQITKLIRNIFARWGTPGSPNDGYPVGSDIALRVANMLVCHALEQHKWLISVPAVPTLEERILVDLAGNPDTLAKWIWLSKYLALWVCKSPYFTDPRVASLYVYLVAYTTIVESASSITQTGEWVTPAVTPKEAASARHGNTIKPWFYALNIACRFAHLKKPSERRALWLICENWMDGFALLPVELQELVSRLRQVNLEDETLRPGDEPMLKFLPLCALPV
jgi:hypothetical protein